MENEWADSTNGFRVTQHYYDALGRETNTVVGIANTPGEATSPTSILHFTLYTLHSSYPSGGSSYSIHTDERGAQTVTSTYHYPDYTEQIAYTTTNQNTWAGRVHTTTTRTYHGGGSSTRREWTDVTAAPSPSQKWTEERRFTDYAPNGYRIDYIVTTSSDHYNLDRYGAYEYVAITNSISTYDLLGRLVTTATPIGEAALSPLQSGAAWLVTSNAYDGATSRILTTTRYVPTLPPRTTTYLYNDWGEQVGTILDNITNRTDTTYEQFSNEWWKVETSTVIGPSTNSLTITRTQLTGLSDSCRRHTITLTGNAAILAATGTTGVPPVDETLTTYDPSTGIETETITSSTGPTIIRRSLHGVLLSTETSGETTYNSYDAFARLTLTGRAAVSAASTGTTGVSPVASYSYSPAGDLLATHTYTNGTGYTTETYAYDMLGNRIATADALGNTTYRTYDPLGNLTAEWGATYPVRYTYDTQGRRTSLTTFHTTGAVALVATDGDTTTWTYDPYTGNCLSKTYADGSTIIYTYTPDNLLLRTTYASGKWKENVYDAQRRLCGVVYSSPDMDYEFQLDAYGNATNVEDSAGNSWRYEYGFNSALIGEECVSASATTNRLSRSIDPFDRPTGYTLSIDNTLKGGVWYSYDVDGHISEIAVTNTAGRIFTVAYTNNADYNYGYTLTTPSGNTIRRVVDRDDYRRSLVTNCATYFNSSLVDSNLYAFDALSRPITRTTGITGILSVASSFAYNDRSEVVSATFGTNLFTHAYDDIGNHVLFGDNTATNTFTHNQVNQMVGRAAPSAPSISFTYTPDGGLASDGTWTYAYDAEDQLVSVTSSSLTNGAIRVLNTYDYRHRRTSKTVQRLYSTIALPPSPPIGVEEWQTFETRTFIHDDWNLIHETIYTIDGSTTNTAEVQYFWGLDLSDSLQGAGGVGGLLAVSRNGQFYFPTFDNNGNVTKYIDESGNVVAAYEYDDFGRIIAQSGSLADFFHHRFSTKYYDPETGLYYYGYRFYSPDWRIWLNHDPLEENGGLHLHGFLENLPVNQIDILGEAVFLVLGGYDNRQGAFKVQQDIMRNALRIPLNAIRELSRFSEKKYECLRRKGRVLFNGTVYDGSLSQYREKIKRELKSKIRLSKAYAEMLKDISGFAREATENYDYIVAAVHGGVAFSDKKTLVGCFSDGTKTQSDIRRGALQSMKNAKGQKLFVSCFQTRQKGKRRLEYSEHIYPVFVKPDGSKTEFLSYRTHRLKRVVQ